VIKDRYEALKAFLLALGDDVQIKELKNYIAFKRIRNFACIEFSPQAGKIYAYIKVNPGSVNIIEGFTRDVRNIGHWGTGDLEITIISDDDIERAKPLLARSYEIN